MQRATYYEHAQACLQQWGNWARRPQFWVNLRGSGMYALFPLPRDIKPERERELDPFSRRIHGCVMAMNDDHAQGVLYAYYVRLVVWDQAPEKFRCYGIARTRFYEVLKDATIRAYNCSKG